MHCAKVTVTGNQTILLRSEVEIMAHIHAEEEGTWLLEGKHFKELLICVAQALIAPGNQNVPIRLVNLGQLPVTVHKNTKISTAKFTDEEINFVCSMCESKHSPMKLDVLLHHLRTL